MQVELVSSLKKLYKNETEILGKDFRDDVDIDRELVSLIGRKSRGSIRVGEGLYFTKNEYKKWKNDILTSGLP